jgi:hypothetical protein
MGAGTRKSSTTRLILKGFRLASDKTHKLFSCVTIAAEKIWALAPENLQQLD